MKIKVNGKQKEILPISKLTFNAFNTILIKNEVVDLKGYLSAFLDLSASEIMEAKIKTISLPALEAHVFDINVEKHVKNAPNTFVFRDKIYEVKDMQFETFGDTYIFDMFHGQYVNKEINHQELSMYALAVWLNHQLKEGDERYDTDKVTDVYKEICAMPWKKTLPISFFLCKKLMRKKRAFLAWSIIYILGLKKIKILRQYPTSRFKHLVKNWLDIR